MDLKDQTCTAEQGARLVELGVKPVATFYHMAPKDGPHGPYIQYGWSSGAVAPAYNVSELGEMLHSRFVTHKSTDRYDLRQGVYYVLSLRQSECGRQYGNTEAEARAAMLIHLLENNLMELPGCTGEAQCINHKKGKATPALLMDKDNWEAACFYCNNEIENQHKWAVENDHKRSRLNKQ